MKNAAILLFLAFLFVSNGCSTEQSVVIKADGSEEDLVARATAFRLHDKRKRAPVTTFTQPN